MQNIKGIAQWRRRKYLRDNCCGGNELGLKAILNSLWQVRGKEYNLRLLGLLFALKFQLHLLVVAATLLLHGMLHSTLLLAYRCNADAFKLSTAVVKLYRHAG